MSELEFYQFRKDNNLLSVHLSVPDSYLSVCCDQNYSRKDVKFSID